MSSPNYDTELIKLEEISITDAGISNKTDMTVIDKESHYHDLNYRFQFGVNHSQKKIRVTFSCAIATFKKNGEKVDIKGNFNIVFFFHIDNLEELVKYDDKEMQVESNVLLSLSNITYSTSRGIIYTRCLGTIFNNVILPVLSTKKLEEIL
ncbi:hypothetical protein [Agriterribacter sp.]|uniref:hypothetical protein n=1 Tax=Agriterribacter sp. TaxID=2821509 RepID=UPI002C65A2AD|nr:hypothetical protein [Agriterribacter sp.]HRP56333.1 hypothetical protein [Agriterribacter sp.]